MMPVGGIQPTKTFGCKHAPGIQLTDLNKQLNKNDWNKIKDYPLMKHFKGIEQEIYSLRDFQNLLTQIFDKNVFMIHGAFINSGDSEKLSNMIRRSRDTKKDGLPPTIKDRDVELFAIDIDNFEYDVAGLKDGPEAIEAFIKYKLPEEFHNADYVYQFSSSYGLTPANEEIKLKAHIFFTPENPINTLSLYNWAKAWNDAMSDSVIDPSIYKPVQPIYTKKRICDKSIDPMDEQNMDFIGYIDKGQPLLEWAPENISAVPKQKASMDLGMFDSDDSEVIESKDVGNLVNLNLDKPKDYDISSSIRKIMSSENFHEPIRSTALSLINKGLSAHDTRVFIEEFMHVAKQSVKDDPERMVDWQLRFDDIPRAVESAIEIVDKPTFDDIREWIEDTDKRQIQAEFAGKLLSFDGVELKSLIRFVDDRTHFGVRAIGDDVKIAKEEKRLEMQDIARKLKSEERKNQGVFEIELTNSTYGTATHSVCKILAESTKKPEVYKLGNSLSIVESTIPKTIRQITKKNALKGDYPPMPVIRDISAPVGVIRGRVEKDCIFLNEQGKEIVCPDSILTAVPKMYGAEWKPLSGIVEHPFVNDEWELVEKNGYDPGTGLYAVMHKKLKITLTDPKEAYNYLVNDVMAEFPFQTKLDEAAAVGMLMSAIQRPYVIGDHGMPGFAIVSPKPSSGKTTLAQLLSYSIYSRPVAATGWSDNDEELGKHLLAILREGHSCVLFDNIAKDASIKSNELAKAMTSGTYSRRKLGSNETEEVPSSVLWLFTGNNIVFKGDFATRILPIRIVPKSERPEFRKFKRTDIGQWAMDNRKKIISAIISIVMAGKDIDYSKIDTSARFKEWDKFVRVPLMEVSGQDLLSVFDRNDFLDDETIAKGELLQMLHKTFGSHNFVTKDIMKLMEGQNLGLGTVAVDSTGSDYTHAITEAFNEKATLNIKTLGRFILGMKDFILGGLMLVREEGLSVAKWKVVEIDVNDGNEETK